MSTLTSPSLSDYTDYNNISDNITDYSESSEATDALNPLCDDYGLPMCKQNRTYIPLVFVISITILVTNLINLFVLTHISGLQDNARSILISLTICDLGVGSMASFFSSRLAFLGAWPNRTVSDVAGLIFTVLCNASVGQIVILMLDRYLCISKPLVYAVSFTHNKCRVAIVLVYCAASVINCLPVFGVGQYAYQADYYFTQLDYQNYMILIVLKSFVWWPSVTLMLTFFYIKIYRVRLRHVGNITAVVGAGNLSTKGLRTYSIATVAVFISWSPFYTYQFARTLQRLNGIHYDKVPSLEFALMWIGISNSFINFPIYNLTFKPYRRYVKKILDRIFKQESIVAAR